MSLSSLFLVENLIDKFNVCNLDWIKLKNTPYENNIKNKSISLIDLFCGCGGMTLGVKEALRINNLNLNIKLALDVDLDNLNVYSRNFKENINILNTDINNIVSSKIGTSLDNKEMIIKNKYSNVDILVAGPPCQGHSNLNNHTRGKDPRNNLYFNVIRFIEITKPKVVIIENVATIIKDKTNIIEKSASFLKNIGYNVKSIKIDASEIGIAQTRKRHIQLAILDKKTNINFLDLINDNKSKTVLNDYIGDIIDENTIKNHIFYKPATMREINKSRVDYLFDNNLYDLPDSERPDCHKNKKHTYTAMYGRLRGDKPAQTITTGFGSMGQGRFIHPSRRRVITPHEAARIQGFPDFFDFKCVSSRKKLYVMIANAVPPKMIAMIIDKLIKDNIIN